MPVRSGRFKSARTIITGRTGRYFRILNTGEFNNTDQTINQIAITGGGGPSSVNVMATFSIDLVANGDVAVAGAGTVEGVYEALPGEEFKSGRFKSRPPLNATVGIPLIVTTNVPAVYRVFNTGPNRIQLFTTNHNGGSPTNLLDQIPEGESLDFAVPNNKIILVKGVGAATDHIEGIYDFLD